MSAQGEHIIKWKVITLLVNTPGEIIKIDEKVPSNYLEILALSLIVVPTDQTIPEIPECGELSLSMNCHTNHFLHTTVGFSEELATACNESFIVGQELHYGRLTGYYLDEKKVVNEEQFFIPYKVKIHMECIIYKRA